MQLSPSDRDNLLATSANAFPGFSFTKESDPAKALGGGNSDDYEMQGGMDDF
jgi:hypothetical protein